jgi:hypothetical protein
MLLLLPFAEPGFWRQTGLEAAVICCLANAVFSAAVLLASSVAARAVVSSGVGGWHGLAMEAATAILIGLPQFLLLVWLLREVEPARFCRAVSGDSAADGH